MYFENKTGAMKKMESGGEGSMFEVGEVWGDLILTFWEG